MTLRTRLTLAGGGAVLVALTAASLVLYVALESKLHDQVDASLIQSAQNVAAKTQAAAVTGKRLPSTSSFFGSDGSGYFQVVTDLGAGVGTSQQSGRSNAVNPLASIVSAKAASLPFR